MLDSARSLTSQSSNLKTEVERFLETVRAAWYRLLDQAGVPRTWMYTGGRHTAATLYRDLGVGLGVTARTAEWSGGLYLPANHPGDIDARMIFGARALGVGLPGGGRRRP